MVCFWPEKSHNLTFVLIIKFLKSLILVSGCIYVLHLIGIWNLGGKSHLYSSSEPMVLRIGHWSKSIRTKASGEESRERHNAASQASRECALWEGVIQELECPVCLEHLPLQRIHGCRLLTSCGSMTRNSEIIMVIIISGFH